MTFAVRVVISIVSAGFLVLIWIVRPKPTMGQRAFFFLASGGRSLRFFKPAVTLSIVILNVYMWCES